jgi:hypothetical protein
VALWQRHVDTLDNYLHRGHDVDDEHHLIIEDRLMDARAHLRRVGSPTHLEDLIGSIGAEPSLVK